MEEENPKNHDFDQRRDGPDQEPTKPSPSVPAIDTSVPTTTTTTGAATAAPHARFADDTLEKSRSANSMPEASRAAPESPITAPPRRSTQMARQRRTSRDFDVRRDGPYGRPSLTMTRRQSGGFGLPGTPTVQNAPESAVVDDGAQRVPMEGDKEGETAVPRRSGEQQDAEQGPTSVETFQSTDPAFEPEPPPLNYTLWTRKLSIAIFWSLILIDSIAMPIALYFGLWYGTDLTPNTVFSIVTAALGGVSILEYVVRFWRLWKHNSTCRVIGARRAYLDWFHWNFSFAWIVVMIELIVGTIPTHPPIRLLAMPLTSMLYAFGTELMIVDIMRYFQYPAPCRISSVPKGAQLRPCVYSIIEDIVAVDGSGGTAYREALNKRYEASHVFRAMLRRLGVAWAVGAQSTAVLCTILIFTIGHDAAYVVGWSVPFIWAGFQTLWTIWYVRRKLAEEKKAWAEEVAAKSNA